MHLIDVLMAGSVFAIASSSSLQLWSATAVRAQQLTQRDQLEQQIETDRLQLQILWRDNLPLQGSSSGCSATAAQLLTLAANSPVTPALRRDLQLSADEQALHIHWRASRDPHLQRERLVTPAGLGLCSLPTTEPAPASDRPETDSPITDSPITDSQVEGLAS